MNNSSIPKESLESVAAVADLAAPCPGIHSRVKAAVAVDPQTADLTVRLTITAHNQTEQTIELREPYPLPKFENLQNLDARDLHNRKLKTVRQNGEGIVQFPEGLAIGPGEDYTWIVTFNCTCFFQKQDEDILGPYPIKAQQEFNGVRVSSHDFEYAFTFYKPQPRRLWPFKEIVVRQVNNRQHGHTIKKKLNKTVCSLKFPLNEGESLRLFLSSHYRFSSMVTLGLTAVGSFAASQWGIDMVRAGFQVVRDLFQ